MTTATDTTQPRWERFPELQRRFGDRDVEMVWVAIHEAGHAVANFATGAAILHAWINKNPHNGHFEGTCLPALKQRRRVAAENVLIHKLTTVLAGREAADMFIDQMYLEDSDYFGGPIADWRMAVEYAERLHGKLHPVDVNNIIEECRVEARRIVEFLRDMVERIAISLIEQRLFLDECFAELNDPGTNDEETSPGKSTQAEPAADH